MDLARLLILAEERLLGRGLASLLEHEFETHSIESFQRANRLLGGDGTEIALWLGDRLDAGTVTQLNRLKRDHPELRLCLLARAADADALRPLLEHDTCGVALLYRSGDLDVAQVLASLTEVVAGRAILEASVLKRLIAAGREDDVLAALSPDELRTLELVAQGLRNREIARRVWKSEKAIEKQVSHVFEKLGLDKRTASYLDRRVTAARIFFSCQPQSPESPRVRGYAPLQ